MTRAAVLHAIPGELQIDEIRVDKPAANEVLLQVTDAGLCHSDLHFMEGLWQTPLPAVMGHESAGIVQAVGEDVTYVQPGDHVISCLSIFCGECRQCLTGHPNRCPNRAAVARPKDAPPRLSSAGGEPLEQFARLGGFAEEMLIHQHAVVKVRDDMPLDRAALIGCGVTTGLGAVFKTARIEPGSTVCVIGAGGIGLSAIQGARIAGAGRVIAVDISDAKLEVARSLGATDTINGAEQDAVEAVRELTSGGVDYAFEAIGLKQTVEQTFEMINAGGTAVVIGMMPFGQKIELAGWEFFMMEKTLKGSMMGSNAFRVDMPRYVDMYLDGRLMLDEMISARLTLEQINEGYEALKRGEVARQVISFRVSDEQSEQRGPPARPAGPRGNRLSDPQEHGAAEPGLHVGYGIVSVQRPDHDSRSWADLYADELALVTEAERHGFDSAWVTEHHFTEDGYLSALFPMLAAMAARTERIHLGTDVILAPLHHPLRLAEDAAAVDCISGGRLVLGLGIGYRDAEFDALGVPKSERPARLVEHVEVCRKAFTGEPFSHRGPVVDVEDLVLRPVPPGPPPIWLGAWVEAGIRRGGRHADGYLAPSGQVDDCRRRAEVFDEAVEQSGRPGKLPFATMSAVAVGGITDAIAAGVAHTTARYGEWYSSSSDEGGGRVVGERIRASSDPTAGIVAGEPEQVLDGLAPLVELLARDRAHHLVVRLAYPGMPRSEAADHIARFAEEVEPALRRLV